MGKAWESKVAKRSAKKSKNGYDKHLQGESRCRT